MGPALLAAVAAVAAGAAAEAPAAQLRLPLAWIHVPKTGTSILNAFTSLACDENWPVFRPVRSQHAFWKVFPMDQGCATGFTSSKDRVAKERALNVTAGLPPPKDWFRSPPGHYGFGKHADTQASLGVTVLRQPEQRIISGYAHNLHSYRSVRGPDGRRITKPTLLQYARVVQGCAVRMLTMGGEPCGWGRITGSVIRQALSTLAAFQYVGITEHWDLSVCLWHRMFGGGPGKPWWARCEPAQFLNTRPGKAWQAGAHGHSTAALEGFVDTVDGRLYEAAKEIFRRNVERYNVTVESCAPCFNQPARQRPRRATGGNMSAEDQASTGASATAVVGAGFLIAGVLSALVLVARWWGGRRPSWQLATASERERVTGSDASTAQSSSCD